MKNRSPIFFFLHPEDQGARQIASSPANVSFKHRAANLSVCLRVSLDHDPKVPGQLISLGSDPAVCDIVLPAEFARQQCHFFLHPRTGELLLRDTSDEKSTFLVSRQSQELGLPKIQPRQRVLLTGEAHYSLRIRDAISFKLVWSRPEAAAQAALAKPGFTQGNMLTDQGTRLLENGRIVHQRIRWLGTGCSATVYLTLNLYSGDHLAVKRFPCYKADEQAEEIKRNAKHEADLLRKLVHPRIVEFVHAQGWSPNQDVELFMKAYEGTALLLLQQWKGAKGNSYQPPFFAKLVTHVLEAIKYLDDHRVVHRDVQLGNILFDKSGNFYLADFGLAKNEDVQNTPVGGILYMPPESIDRDQIQSVKGDVWATGVMILELLDILPRFPIGDEVAKRQIIFGDRASFERWFDLLRKRVSERIPQILPMFEIDQMMRYSARDCLRRIFNHDSKFSDMPKQTMSTPRGGATSIPTRRTIDVKPGVALSRAGSDPALVYGDHDGSYRPAIAIQSAPQPSYLTKPNFSDQLLQMQERGNERAVSERPDPPQISGDAQRSGPLQKIAKAETRTMTRPDSARDVQTPPPPQAVVSRRGDVPTETGGSSGTPWEAIQSSQRGRSAQSVRRGNTPLEALDTSQRGVFVITGSQRGRLSEAPEVSQRGIPLETSSRRGRSSEAPESSQRDAPTETGSQRGRSSEAPESSQRDIPTETGSQRGRSSEAPETPQRSTSRQTAGTSQRSLVSRRRPGGEVPDAARSRLEPQRSRSSTRGQIQAGRPDFWALLKAGYASYRREGSSKHEPSPPIYLGLARCEEMHGREAEKLRSTAVPGPGETGQLDFWATVQERYEQWKRQDPFWRESSPLYRELAQLEDVHRRQFRQQSAHSLGRQGRGNDESRRQHPLRSRPTEGDSSSSASPDRGFPARKEESIARRASGSGQRSSRRTEKEIGSSSQQRQRGGEADQQRRSRREARDRTEGPPQEHDQVAARQTRRSVRRASLGQSSSEFHRIQAEVDVLVAGAGNVEPKKEPPHLGSALRRNLLPDQGATEASDLLQRYLEQQVVAAKAEEGSAAAPKAEEESGAAAAKKEGGSAAARRSRASRSQPRSARAARPRRGSQETRSPHRDALAQTEREIALARAKQRRSQISSHTGAQQSSTPVQPPPKGCCMIS